MWKGGLPTTIDVTDTVSAEGQEMTRTDVVATWERPVVVFYAKSVRLE